MTTPERDRIIDLDVVRAVALIGVVTMNYHGYLILAGGDRGSDFVHRIFNPWTGPMSTRFAATFVTVAGMGVTLMTNRSRLSGDRTAIADDRWRLVRRGFLLYAIGYVFNWIWPGTILFFYGAFFIVAALLFTLRVRWLALIGVGAMVVAAALQWWDYSRTRDGGSLYWLFGSSYQSPRGLVFDTFVNGTHPLFPWLAFLCTGIILGRSLPFSARLRIRLVVAGVVLVAVTYSLHHLFVSRSPLSARLFATDPFSRSAVYALCALGTSIAAVAAVGWIAARTSTMRVTRWLAITGRSTLTLYVLHALVFNLLVNVWRWIRPAGLDTALLLAGTYWVVAIIVAVLWHHRFGMAPLERLYRRFGA